MGSPTDGGEEPKPVGQGVASLSANSLRKKDVDRGASSDSSTRHVAPTCQVDRDTFWWTSSSTPAHGCHTHEGKAFGDWQEPGPMQMVGSFEGVGYLI